MPILPLVKMRLVWKKYERLACGFPVCATGHRM